MPWTRYRRTLLGLAMLALLAAAPAIAQWGAPTNVTNSPGYWSGPVDIDFDASGNVHMVYEEWWDAYHEVRYANNVGGVWTNSLLMANARGPMIRITPDQVMHVLFKGKISDQSRVVEVTKPVVGGAWSAAQPVTPDYTNGDEWLDSVAVDATGAMYATWLHLWADDTPNPSAIWGSYRALGGAWGPAELIRKDTRDHWPTGGQVIGSGSKFYITYDLNGARYKVRQGGSLGSEKTISSSGGGGRIAVSPTGEMAAAWGEDIGGDAWYEVLAKFSNDGGATWSTPVNISNHNGLDRMPEITYDAAGSFRLIYQRFEYDGAQPDIWMTSRISGAWQPIWNLTATSGRTASPVQSLRARGNDLHFIFTDNTANGVEDVFYQMKQGAQDPVPPGPPTALTALPGDNRVQLSWTNPSDPDYMGTIVRMSTSGYPAGPFSDTLVCIRSGSPNVNDSYLVYPVTASVRYYFSVFAEDFAGNWSVAAQTTAVPTADHTAPANVASFIVSNPVTPGTLALSWTNPTDPDFKGTLVRYKTTGYPTSATDGSLACNKTAAPGSQGSFTHSGLTNGATYYYKAFAYDFDSNYSSGMGGQGVPKEPACSWVKLLPDGTAANLQGKVVTGLFPNGGYLYVEEPDRSAGIRVVGSTTGLNLGDRVNITGSMASVTMSGYACERSVVATDVTKAASGSAIKPMAVSCLSVGGGAVAPYVMGVQDATGKLGVGLNNIGLLVRIAGKLSYKVSNVLYIDDGSNIADTSGRRGVMVICPDSSIPAVVGNMVCATGIVEGSVPTATGWSNNRRCIQIRDYTDLKVYTSAGTISGTVRDTAGNAIVGAIVATTAGGYTTTSTTGGSYTLSNITPATYTVTASRSGYTSQSVVSVPVLAMQTATVDFALAPQVGSITGYVRDSFNNPVSGATVSTTSGGYTTTSAANGSYTLSNVAIGTYSVSATKAGYTTHTVSGVAVASTQTTSVSFSISSATEKVNNGDMEGGFFSTGWNSSCSSSTSKLPGPSSSVWGWNNDGSYPFNTYDYTGTKHAGSHSLGLSFCATAAQPGKLGIAFQSVNLYSANANATFSVWAYHTNSYCPSIMCWNPGVAQGNPSTAYSAGRYQTVCTDSSGQVGVWVNRTMTVTADSSGYVTIMVGGASNAGAAGGSAVYIDDVSVK